MENYHTTVEELDLMQRARAQGIQHVDLEVISFIDGGRQVIKLIGRKALERIAAENAKRMGSKFSIKPNVPSVKTTAPKGPAGATVTSGEATLNPKNANSAVALQSKLKELEKAQARADKVIELPDGRVRYYEPLREAKNPGYTKGNRRVVEHNPQDGTIRAWEESYNHTGRVIRVHPKTINGQKLESQHYPLTKSELGQ